MNYSLAYFYYPEDLKCTVGSDTLPSPIKSLSCELSCIDGESLDVDIETKSSVCKKCPSNTYSTSGVLIDGEMGDWDRI